MSISTTHRNYSHHWWTPPEWIDWVEETLGDWHDPCPREYFRGRVSGIGRDTWGNRFYCNHPGSRGSTAVWWPEFVRHLGHHSGWGYLNSGIWCAFSAEQKRHMRPSCYDMPGWLIEPRKRIGFVWGGPDTDKLRYGERGKSPGDWAVFWSSVEPTEPPEECVIVRTG